MKINDVITEAPAGLLSRAASALGSKLRPTVSGRAQSAGARDVKKVADTLWKQFQKYLGQTGMDPNAVRAADLKKYLTSNKSIGYNQSTVDKALNGMNIKGSDLLTSDKLERAFMAIAQQAMLTGTKASPSTQGTSAGSVTIDPKIITAVKGLSDEQKAALIQALQK